MSGDIKKEYQRNLGAILLIAAFLCLIIQFGFNSLLGFISSQSDILDMMIVFVEFVLTSVLSALIMSMLSNFLPSNMKYRLVFLKWRDFLPACRINDICKNDSRFDLSQAKIYWPSIFGENITPEKRNQEWYGKIYNGMRDKPAVRQANRDFLLYRDAASAFLILLLISGIFCLTGIAGYVPLMKLQVLIVPLVALLMFIFLAQTAGKRLVSNTVAIAVAEK